MKKAALSAFSLALLFGSVSAQGLKGDGKYGTAGCGLGSMVFHDQAGHIQILAATTNNAIFPQTSAISSGTSNCFEDGVALKDKEQEFFAGANFESLHQEMALGRGENLHAFASLFGCTGQGVEKFSQAARLRYQTIFPSGSTTADRMLVEVQDMVKTDPELQASCSERG